MFDAANGGVEYVEGVDVSLVDTPEPASGGLIVVGLAAIGMLRRRSVPTKG